MAKSQASVYEVEFGSVTGSGKVKRAFVKDAGRDSVAMKMVWVSVSLNIRHHPSRTIWARG